jgi:hypothetical protein
MSSDPTRVMEAGPSGSVTAAENFGSGLKLTQPQADAWGPTLNVLSDPLARINWDLFADGTPRLSGVRSDYLRDAHDEVPMPAAVDVDSETGVSTYAVPTPVIEAHQLPLMEPLAVRRGLNGNTLTLGEMALGVTEIVASGIYNQGVKIAGGLASIPYALVDGLDAGVAVQRSFNEAISWTADSDGAQMIARGLAPVGQAVGQVTKAVRGFSEQYLGDGLTTILGTGLQAGIEIAGTMGGLKGAQSLLATSLDNSVFVWRATPGGLNGSIGIPSSLDSVLPVRITTVTPEMSRQFQGMGYLDPLTNRFMPAPANATMPVDHIFPVADIVRVPGFDRLTTQQMTNIIQDRIGLDNLQPLPGTFNSSKGASTARGDI